ncbi:hypothetical protein V6N13_134319 [Hibiscus sabdariffa]|uniref:Glycoside hydrolase family 19 catalytic domain-containing protein n=1 Tax=Hibiscus sabdariffa TaxID=183260 RepID=A0ABR2R3G7_9ROSI
MCSFAVAKVATTMMILPGLGSEAFTAAAKSYPAFATTGSHEIRKREVAAFLGQTSFRTAGGIGWTPSIGPYTWGYCYKKEDNPLQIIVSQTPATRALLVGIIVVGVPYYLPGRKKNLLQNPDLLIKNMTMAFEAVLWFWMTPQPPKPSSHELIIGNWHGDEEGRLPGYCVITNIIDHWECGIGADTRAADRIEYYQRYCNILGVGSGENFDCYSQKPY